METFNTEALAQFDQSTMVKLAGILGMAAQADIAALRSDLIETCAHYRSVISALPCDLPQAPFNLSLTKRVEWLETNVIKPCERLQSAICNNMQPMFSTWPYPLSVPKFRDNSALDQELAELHAQASSLRDDLQGQQTSDAGHSQEVRQEIFSAIARLLRKHCPKLKPNRGVYDAELRRRIGVYPDAMRLIFAKIVGVEENLDRLIRSEIGMPS